MKAAALYIPS